ncbi:hypothetical protein PtrSN002B_001667 [Pyrenophora tritici-repentis]|uniref:DUF4045 multi-domain protein n=1 Tax=Pyrenophora tritici-repentis TaxID=45151 RepID=A0A2W1F504_9PLEO|nr:hypothetical protein PtrV1_00343 [Pyrenophora tritici-repentis]KAF7453060.1 hypothetical protein A1F99_003180 [Pyrenophora tritici-repentis]KAF7576107.1 DUF4045 multi-domain protein [Pyrenophora tritici-repentis]KAG9377486.1 hypothetical protein A1F94_011889 [Pyrenophora tritici-repentis]KAI0581448.1 hypothetical protein Alg130_06569 [Pyrenophora tritici-repentis]
MARRSARLLKRETTPDASADDSWHTASSPGLKLPDLPELPELPEPGMAKTPSKASEGLQPPSRLPQAKTTATPTATPHKNKALLAAASQTPKDRTPIKPAGQEMHPAHHRASTAKVLDEARWLGFQSLGAHTAPPKAMGLAGQGTPSKTPVPSAATTKQDVGSSPEFRFRFKSPLPALNKSAQDEATLSPTSRNILREAGIAGTPGGGTRALFGTSEWSSKDDVSPQRKKAEAKGKMARFSDVHMKQFKNMDSIANHASAFRADPSRFKPVVGPSLKKSNSRSDLAKPETNKLKRTQSKADLAESSTKSDIGLKRTQSKMDLAGPSAPRSESTTRMPPPARSVRPASSDGDSNPGSKRVKRTESDDAATTRPASHESKGKAPVVAATPRKITSQTALPRVAARLMTPTKSSIARSQSVQTMKTTSMIPTFARGPSTNALAKSPSASRLLSSPSNVSHLQAMRDGARESLRKASHNLQRVRSILRTPNRKFSHDPSKIAAGTHMSPPPVSDFDKGLPAIPATAPAKKHVNFSSSTLERASHDEMGKSPSPMKFRAGSEVPPGAVVYPTLNTDIPELAQEVDTLTASPSRRLTFGGAAPNHPRSFSFESSKTVNFGPISTGTIRMVRQSDAPSGIEVKKRKLDTVQETSDKENDGPTEEDTRSAKKMKHAPVPTPKKPASASKLSGHTPGRRTNGMSKSRLAFLATPKRSKA